MTIKNAQDARALSDKSSSEGADPMVEVLVDRCLILIEEQARKPKGPRQIVNPLMESPVPVKPEVEAAVYTRLQQLGFVVDILVIPLVCRDRVKVMW